MRAGIDKNTTAEVVMVFVANIDSMTWQDCCGDLVGVIEPVIKSVGVSVTMVVCASCDDCDPGEPHKSTQWGALDYNCH